MMTKTSGLVRLLVLILVTVVVFTLLVKLGLWQLDRAKEKEEWQATLTQRQASSPLSFSALLTKANDEPLTGWQLTLTATPVNATLLLLDNQVHQGHVGYLAYQLLVVEPEQPWILAELGFIEAGLHRDKLPIVQPLVGSQALTGRLYQRQNNPMSEHLMAEANFSLNDTQTIRFQNLNFPELAKLIGHPLVPAVLQPFDDIAWNSTGTALAKPWLPIPLSAQKHRGYALQWFTMAAVFGGIMLWLTIKKIVKVSTENQSKNAPK